MPYYMKLADERGLLVVRGDVKAKGYEGWISLTSAQIAATRVAPSGQGTARDQGRPKSMIITKDTDATTARLVHLGSHPSAAPITCTIVFIADGATTPYMTVEIWSASILTSSGTRGEDQIEIVGDISVKQKSAPPPSRRESWGDYRSYG